MELLNPTPLVMDRAILWDRNGAEQLILALKGTWDIGTDGNLRLAEEQTPMVLVDEFLDDPADSSIVNEGELGPPKLATDIFLTGSAKAPRGGTRVMDVRLKIGNLGRVARVTGPRVWGKRLGIAKASDPEPFESVPLIWENAFGGTDLTPDKDKHHAWCDENPVGRGFRAKRSQLDWVDQPLPCIEDPRDPLQKPGQKVRPVGFGPIGRHWEPRVQYAGTYDDAWTEERMPLLPLDFDDRFHNAAPPGLVADGFLHGGEAVEVVGCTHDHVLNLMLPRLTAHGLAVVADEPRQVPLDLNTVTIDTDAMQLRLLWKGAIGVHGQLERVDPVECSIEGDLS